MDAKRIVPAKYDGFCINCERLIAENEKVFVTDEGWYLCLDCAEKDTKEDCKRDTKDT